MIDIHRLALRELRDANRYYRARSRRVADRFQIAFAAATEKLGRNPEGCDPLHGDYRAVQFKKFPYRLIFAIEPDDSLFILAVAHDRRRPNYLRRRSRLN